jgi:uncharacterized small protein (DUF1192 family)
VGSGRVTKLVAASDRVLERERNGLLMGVEELTQRVAVHRAVLDQLEVELATKQRLLQEVEELTDRRPQLRLERLDKQLKGRRLQEVAVAILRERLEADEPVHYRRWFGWLTAAGYEVPAKDPLNAFLTCVGRAEGIERVGQRSGLYRLSA